MYYQLNALPSLTGQIKGLACLLTFKFLNSLFIKTHFMKPETYTIHAFTLKIHSNSEQEEIQHGTHSTTTTNNQAK